METPDPVAFLRFALGHFSIPIDREEGRHFYLPNGLQVECEANGLFKLSQYGEVIAPFDDMEELCGFLQRTLEQ
ncbi:MAG: hypothetical protein AAF399_06095 [Bacteroidota bacterium]